MMEDGRETQHGERWQSILHTLVSFSRWGPVLLWMPGIFCLSSHSRPLALISGSLRMHGGSIERAAHFADYGVFAWLLRRALSNSNRPQRHPVSLIRLRCLAP